MAYFDLGCFWMTILEFAGLKKGRVCVAKGCSESHEIRVMVAIVSTKDDWTLLIIKVKILHTSV